MAKQLDPDPGGWTVSTLRTHLEAMLAASAELARQRFGDQDKAVQAALVAQEKAVAAALAATERAVIKAETAAEKRFDANNEFRGQLADQAATLMPRAEAEQRLGSLEEKSEQAVKALTDRVGELADRINRSEGTTSGVSASRSERRLDLGNIVAVVAVLALILSVLLPHLR
jgi:hypothetical protein